MAETVYKPIPGLDPLQGSLDGSETLPVVKSGKTYRRSWTNFFGSGWMANLLQAFSSFVAPNATHADDADTVGGEDKAALHNAANLTGNINLDRIPATLTGKSADKWITARTLALDGFISGSASIDGSGNVTMTTSITSGTVKTGIGAGGIIPANTTFPAKIVLFDHSAGTTTFLTKTSLYAVPADCLAFIL